jgi:hypothetical protein
VVLGQDQPFPLIEEELIPQGHAKDAAALNVNLVPFDIAGVEALSIVYANTDKIDNYKNSDNDNGIIAVDDIPQQPHHNPLVVNDTNDNDEGSNGKPADEPNDDDDHYNDDNKERIDDSLEEGDEDAQVDKHEPDENGNQGVQRLRHKGRDIVKKYANYG